MKYSLKKFNSAVNFYKKALGKIDGKTIVLVSGFESKKAFYSIAPLSRAVDELKAELIVLIFEGNSQSFEALNDVWNAFAGLKAGKADEKTLALKEFIESVNKKAKNSDFEKIFKKPEKIFLADEHCFISTDFNQNLGYHAEWFHERHWNKLLETASLILRDGFALKKGEVFSLSFELIPSVKKLELPLEDILDNFSIARAFAFSAKKLGAIPRLGSSTGKESQLEPMNHVSDLSTTLLGCEHSKSIGLKIFKNFKKLSKLLKLERFKASDAAFGIHGKGYGGRHFFGTRIGYPTPNLKSKWSAPGQMFLKPWWHQQTSQDNRLPKTRYAITETLPIERFIRTCNVSYDRMRKRNNFIEKAIEKSQKIVVQGKELGGVKTDLEVFLDKKNLIWESDSDVRSKLNKAVLKKFKINAGSFGNFPSGETFFTPEKMNGTFIGDLVICIDQSYEISEKKPLVIKAKNDFYKIVSGERKILQKISKRKNESWKIIREYEKHKSLPKELIESYKANFERIGEFAVNTSPFARKSIYLIEMEKMAKMMHIALGSGFEPSRETTYHMDIVINAPRQKMDIYGIGKNGEKHWIMKGGKLLAK